VSADDTVRTTDARAASAPVPRQLSALEPVRAPAAGVVVLSPRGSQELSGDQALRAAVG